MSAPARIGIEAGSTGLAAEILVQGFDLGLYLGRTEIGPLAYRFAIVNDVYNDRYREDFERRAAAFLQDFPFLNFGLQEFFKILQ